jgi:hypothetical protein
MRRRWRAGLLAGIGLMAALGIGGRPDSAAAAGPSRVDAMIRDLMWATAVGDWQRAQHIRDLLGSTNPDQEVFLGHLVGPPPFAEESETPVQNATRDAFAGLNLNAQNPVGAATILSPDFQIGVIGGVQHLSNSGDIGHEQALGLTRNMPGFSANDYDVGFAGTWNASRVLNLPANQALLLTAAFIHNSTNLNGEADLGLPTGGAHADGWSFAGNALYWFNQTYLNGTALIERNAATINNAASGGTGDTHLNGYVLDAALGHVFTLWGIAPTAGRFSGLPTKAPKVTVPVYGWRAAFLDVDVHLQTQRVDADSFVDSAGIPFGDATLKESDVGVRARLAGLYVGPNFVVAPYVGVGFDHIFNFSQQANLPANALFPPVPDAINFDVARDTTRLEAGASFLIGRSFVVSANIYHTSSSDTKTTGGWASASWLF